MASRPSPFPHPFLLYLHKSLSSFKVHFKPTDSKKARLPLHEWDCPKPPPEIPAPVPGARLKDSSQPAGLWSPPPQTSWGAASTLAASAALAQKGCSASIYLDVFKGLRTSEYSRPPQPPHPPPSISGQGRATWANVLFKNPIQRDFTMGELLFPSTG